MKRMLPMLALALVLAVVACGSTDSETQEPTKFTCDLPLNCQPVHAQYPTLPSSPDVTCLLESLRDRVPGRYEYGFVVTYSGVKYTLWVLEDGTAAIESTYGNDVGETEVTPAAHYELKPPSYFETCLAATTDEERYTCTLENTSGPLSTPMKCP